MNDKITTGKATYSSCLRQCIIVTYNTYSNTKFMT